MESQTDYHVANYGKPAFSDNLPYNAVTRMPIKNQQWEADLIADGIRELEDELIKKRQTLARRLAWIEEAKRLGRP